MMIRSCLAWVMQYLRENKELGLTLEGYNVNLPLWGVDASFAVHTDMHRHTGGILSFGNGAVYSTAIAKRSINKAQPRLHGWWVGVHNVLPQVIWTVNFLGAQKYLMDASLVYHDNQIFYSNGQTIDKCRSANAAFMGMHDVLPQVIWTGNFLGAQEYLMDASLVYHDNQMTITYCPTEEIVAYFFTKPLQGNLFHKFRVISLNLSNTLDCCLDPRMVLEQGVMINVTD